MLKLIRSILAALAMLGIVGIAQGQEYTPCELKYFSPAILAGGGGSVFGTSERREGFYLCAFGSGDKSWLAEPSAWRYLEQAIKYAEQTPSPQAFLALHTDKSLSQLHEILVQAVADSVKEEYQRFKKTLASWVNQQADQDLSAQLGWASGLYFEYGDFLQVGGFVETVDDENFGMIYDRARAKHVFEQADKELGLSAPVTLGAFLQCWGAVDTRVSVHNLELCKADVVFGQRLTI